MWPATGRRLAWSVASLYFRGRSVALDEAVDRAQMLDRVALAPHLIEQLGQVAMRLDHGGIAFEGAIQAANGRIILAGFAIEQSQLVVNLRVSGHDRRRTEEVAQRAFQIAFVIEQRGEAHVRVEIDRLATD